jgi:hypothetical protein
VGVWGGSKGVLEAEEEYGSGGGSAAVERDSDGSRNGLRA